MMKSANKLTIICFALIAVVAAAYGQTAREVAKKAFPSVVILLMDDKNGQLASLGSGFFVEEGIVASNFHVIEGASRGLVKLIGDNAKYEIEGVIAADETNDLVLLKIRTLKAPPLPLGNSDSVAVGDELYAVGNPRGLEGTFSQGIVSGIRKLETGSLIQITAPISPGSSGGPILDTKGQVIGVAVATFKGGQNLNFAIPATAVRALLAKKSLKPLPTIQTRKTEASILKDLGPRNTAGVVARKIEWPFTYHFKFSILNQLQQPIRDATFLATFYDDEDQPIDFKIVANNKVIPAGLAVWTETVQVDESTARYCSTLDLWQNRRKGAKAGRVELRVLGFDLVEE